MTTFVIGVIVSIITGALVNEFCDVSPWLARKVARRAAKMWALGDEDIAREYGEEWSRVVDDCPGKLTKLGRAFQFAFGAAVRVAEYRAEQAAQSALTALAMRIASLLGHKDQVDEYRRHRAYADWFLSTSQKTVTPTTARASATVYGPEVASTFNVARPTTVRASATIYGPGSIDESD